MSELKKIHFIVVDDEDGAFYPIFTNFPQEFRFDELMIEARNLILVAQRIDNFISKA